jgi:hypothetical protein
VQVHHAPMRHQRLGQRLGNAAHSTNREEEALVQQCD